MRFRDGTLVGKLLFAIFIAVYVLGVAINLSDKANRIGKPDLGWIVDDGNLSPTREDVSQAGLRGGGRPLEINGRTYEFSAFGELPTTQRWVHTGLGQSNTLTLLRPTGEIRTMTVPVRLWTWEDALFSEGATFFVGLMFFVVGSITFVLRPYTQPSWALLAIGTLTGGSLSTLFLPIQGQHALASIYFLLLVGLVNVVPLHGALAFPVPHPIFKKFPGVVWIVYAIGLAQAIIYLVGWQHGFHGPFGWTRIEGAVMLLLTTLIFVVRCLRLSFDEDTLVAQRARILLGGALFGLAPIGVVQVIQQGFRAFPIDSRFTYWPLAVFVLALGRVTLRQELMNSRIAVRRGVLYGTAVVVLTALAWLLTMVSPYAVAILLLPVLYVWPRFDDRLNSILYPKRERFPEILREIGDEMAAATSIDSVLDQLAAAPTKLCDSVRSVAFILPGHGHQEEHIRVSDGTEVDEGGPLADEPLVQMMRATRQTVLRSQIGMLPQFAEVTEASRSGFARFRAEILQPIVQHGSVIGGLAIGPRSADDVYERAELAVLTTAGQQAVQAIIRVEATDRLRDRELEFADLKRFFPPQIIDRVMARGGASELRSQRKIVTVLFADLRGFTSFSDRVEPEEVMSTLAEYHEAMGHRIAEFAGTLERFAGDGFMVFFNDPVRQIDHAERAVGMSLAMREDVVTLRHGWVAKGYDIDIGIGIHTGYATCGFVGYEGRRDYSVIGNVTNLAARLSDAAAPGEILITSRVRGELRNGHHAEPTEPLTLKGFPRPQPAFRLLPGDGD